MSLLLALLTPLAHAAPADDVLFDYQGPTGAGSYPASVIVALVRASPRESHTVRGPGAKDWTPWNQVPALAEAWLASSGAPAPSPPPTDAPAPDAAGAGGAEPAVALNPPQRPPRDDAPPPVARPTTAPPLRPTVTLGGDVRIDFTAANLERIGAAGEPAPPAGFNVSRARPIVDVALGDVFSGRLAIEVRQDPTVTTHDVTSVDETTATTTVDVADWAQGWSIQGREIYLQAEAGEGLRHRVRVGLQEPAFGARERYEDDYPFAGEERADFGRRLGLVPAEDLGIGWRGALGERWGFDLQVLNGSGGTSVDENDGKDFLARVELAPIEAVRLSLSGQYGARGEGSIGEQGQGAVTIEVRGAHQRILVEGVIGATTEDRIDTFSSGAAASAAWDVPVNAGALDALTLVGRFRFHDPIAGMRYPDAWWGPAAGAWVHWKVAEGQVVRTGATWEMYTPQDSLLPIEQSVVAEAAWQF